MKRTSKLKITYMYLFSYKLRLFLSILHLDIFESKIDFLRAKKLVKSVLLCYLFKMTQISIFLPWNNFSIKPQKETTNSKMQKKLHKTFFFRQNVMSNNCCLISNVLFLVKTDSYFSTTSQDFFSSLSYKLHQCQG